MTDTVLVVRNLAVTFDSELGTSVALDHIDFTMRRSRTTAIVGESGSGKSVTANAIMRLIEPPGRITAGEILFTPDPGEAPFDILSLDGRSDAIYHLRGGQIAMIFQEPMTALSPVHTIGDQVSEAIINHQDLTPDEARQRTIEMLAAVGIDAPETRYTQYPFEFSGGMRQRVVIAMALVCRPRILICDEPTTSLDVTIQAEILSLINDLKGQFDTSVMFITHDLSVVAQVADDVVVMYRGRVLETGSVREVLRSPLHPYTQALLSAIPHRTSGQPRGPLPVMTNEPDWESWPLVQIGEGRAVARPPEARRG